MHSTHIQLFNIDLVITQHSGGQQQLQLIITYISVLFSIVLNISSQLKQQEKLSQIQSINSIHPTHHDDPQQYQPLSPTRNISGRQRS